MAFFPRFPAGEFAPLFRMLDDYASHTASREGSGVGGASSLRSFTPKFDIRELKDNYELHGELPGIAQKDINIEFTDASTLTISGRTERSYEQRTKPAAAIEGAESHQPTVEDEPEGSTTQSTSGAVTTQNQSQDISKNTADPSRYWVSERSIGEFSRSFSFPNRVDQDAVKANLKDGVLTIVVPKAKAPTPRKINIE
ncbi:30 kDa heat shock protein [Viridothelium virens]|uniref:30 kDa heat shock protein n=1 Tax=Viridothelium virens TaxID=1048519 RepID=A0A6A6HM49_VIRVR|nr:30 kDa heat shock protein [Viridothelium virens]